MTDPPQPASLSPDLLRAIAAQFVPQGTITDIQAFGQGNINDTFLVTGTGFDAPHFILQRINTQVFRQPQAVMQNMRVVTEHVGDRLRQLSSGGGLQNRRWEMPRVLLTADGDHYIDPDSQTVWRAMSFIDQSQSFDTIQDHHHAQEIGQALGTFHHLISDLPPQRLVDSLPGFHIAPSYLHAYDAVLAAHPVSAAPEVQYCLQMVSDRRSWVAVLETAKADEKLPLRLMHGDPKINNIMIDTVTGHAVSMVDLDTVKPGLIHYDLGDCLRSACNPLGEETDDWDAVRFETDLCEIILRGYCTQARAFLTDNDYAYLYDAIALIAFELGLRFFADYLAGNPYFKVQHSQHNLSRAIVQFKLTESIEAQAPAIRSIIQSVK